MSRNETESLCSKAARGAGMSWGLAEEAGFAAGWLVSHDLDGPDVMSRHLNTVQYQSWQDIRPIVNACEWHTAHRGTPLCPVALGATICDHFCINPSMFQGNGLLVARLSHPGLLLPFLALATRETAVAPTHAFSHANTTALLLRCGNIAVYLDRQGRLGGDVSALMLADCADLEVSTVELGSLPIVLSDKVGDCRVINGHVINNLNRLALRTTVPTSAASRANAGADGGDND